MTRASVRRAVQLVMTLLARNEVDVVRANLEYHYERGVSFVIATDNASTDGTTEVLHEYERQGRLHLIHEPTLDYDQPRWVTRMARLAATEFKADWVINNDADEFWWPDEGSLPDVLGAVPRRYGAVTAPRANFLPTAGDEAAFYDRLVYRFRVGRNGDRELPPKTCHRGRRHVVVHRGAHKVSGRFTRPSPNPPPITVLHFPMRSWSQFETKVATSGASLFETSTSPPRRQARVLRAQFDDYKAGRLREQWDAQVLSEAALQSALEQGTVVEDRRLADYFGAHPL